MSLATDNIFVTALKSNAELVEALGGVVADPNDKSVEEKAPRLYGTAIPLPDEDLDNVPLPYVIVTFDGLNNDTDTKDCPYEGSYDHVNIGIVVVNKTLTSLHTLTQMVRDTVLGYFRETETDVEDYMMSAERIEFDQLKPSYCQVLRYQCEVRLHNEEDGEEE